MEFFSEPDLHQHNIDARPLDIASDIWRFLVDRNGDRYPSKSHALRVAHDQVNRPVKCDVVDVFIRTWE